MLILPNITYRFKIQLKDKHLNWTDVEETEPIFIPLKMRIEQRGQTVVNTSGSTDQSERFELACLSNINRNIQHQISWTRDDRELAVNDNGGQNSFSIYIANDTMYANSVLVFKRFHNDSANYTGVYKCSIYIRYPEVGQGTSYLSDGHFVNFIFNSMSSSFYPNYLKEASKKKKGIHFKGPLTYEKTVGNISLPTVPGLLLELNCQVSGQPINSVQWLIDGVSLDDEQSKENEPSDITDKPFLINITDPKDASLHAILVMKIDTAKKPAKYECLLNDQIVVRSHFIEIVEQKPELDVRVDRSQLNNLSLAIDIRVKNKPYTAKYGVGGNSIQAQPLKFAIMFVENSTLNDAVQTNIAPNTLSRIETWTAGPNRIKLGSLKPARNDMQSCKLACFNTPFCRSYDFLMYDDSCNFYSDSTTDSYYRKLIETLKNSSASSNFTFNLIHLLQPDLLNLNEEKVISFVHS